MTLRLKSAIAEAGFTQGSFATAMQLSRPALSGWCNHDRLPTGIDRADVEQRARTLLSLRGVDTAGVFVHEQEKAPPCSNTATPDSPTTTDSSEEDVSMLLRKVSLSQTTRRHFEVPRDPFGAGVVVAFQLVGAEVGLESIIIDLVIHDDLALGRIARLAGQ